MKPEEWYDSGIKRTENKNSQAFFKIDFLGKP
jgi:hypothetical protein